MPQVSGGLSWLFQMQALSRLRSVALHPTALRFSQLHPIEVWRTKCSGKVIAR